jgi:hypothetical protein
MAVHRAASQPRPPPRAPPPSAPARSNTATASISGTALSSSHLLVRAPRSALHQFNRLRRCGRRWDCAISRFANGPFYIRGAGGAAIGSGYSSSADSRVGLIVTDGGDLAFGTPARACGLRALAGLRNRRPRRELRSAPVVPTVPGGRTFPWRRSNWHFCPIGDHGLRHWRQASGQSPRTGAPRLWTPYFSGVQKKSSRWVPSSALPILRECEVG